MTHYYAEGVYDYADVVFRVNGTMQKGEYQIQVAGRPSVSFVHAIPSRSFDKKILKKFMGENYRESSARVVTWDDRALEMQRQNVHPLNGLFWGERQVVRLQWKCTGTPTAVNKHDYLTEYKVRDRRGDWHVQCDCIVLVTVRKAEGGRRWSWRWRVATWTSLGLTVARARARGVTHHALLLADARRERRGTRTW